MFTDSRNICPAGWHVPTDEEWTTLTEYLGGVDVAGGKLKETGTTHWRNPNTGATNESGFTALPGGYRYFYGSFDSFGVAGYWWSSTQFSAASAWCRYMNSYDAGIERYHYGLNYGFSVRCVKNP